MSTSSAVSAAPSFPLSTHVSARAGSQAVILTLAIALTVAVSRRCPTSIYSLRRLSLEGSLALAIVVVALAFVYISAILLASGTSASSRACAGGVLLCFLSYGA